MLEYLQVINESSLKGRTSLFEMGEETHPFLSQTVSFSLNPLGQRGGFVVVVRKVALSFCMPAIGLPVNLMPTMHNFINNFVLFISEYCWTVTINDYSTSIRYWWGCERPTIFKSTVTQGRNWPSDRKTVWVDGQNSNWTANDGGESYTLMLTLESRCIPILRWDVLSMRALANH